MAHNTLVKGGVGSGSWTNVPVVHGYMEQLDQYCFQSINGDLGGTWAPSSQIIIGGSGIQVTGGLTVAGSGGTVTADVSVNSAATLRFNHGFINLNGTSSVTSACSWFGTYTFDVTSEIDINTASFFVNSGGKIEVKSGGAVQLDSGATCTVQSGATFQTNAGATCTLNSNVSCTGVVTVSNTLTCNNASQVNLQGIVNIASTASTTCYSAITLAGQGHVNERLFSLTNADLTKGINDADVIYLAASVYNADHILTVTSTGAVSGSWIRIYSNDSAFKITVQNDNGVAICLVKHGSGTAAPPAGFFQWVDLMHNGAANGWFIIGGWSA